MKTANHIVRYLLAGILVAILGGLLGWYVFVHKQVAANQAIDAARGLGTPDSFGSSNGSTYKNTGGSASLSTTGSSTVATGATGTQAPRLWQVTPSPVAGMGFIASTTRLDFVERATGNILEADPSQTKVTRRTNTLFAKIYEAQFARDGGVLLRSLNDAGMVTTFVGTPASSSPDQINAPVALQGLYLPQGISDVAVRASGSQLFFLSPTAAGTTGIMTDWKAATEKKLFASALTGWQTQWLSDGKIYLTQNAADNIGGYAFQLSPTGTLTPVLGGLPGLSILPRTGSPALIYSTSVGGTLTLYAKASATADAVALPIKTVAEKCVWSPWSGLVAYCAVPKAILTDTFLNSWYKGTTHTEDSWWKIDVSAGTAEEFYTVDSKYSLDVVQPTIDDSGGYIAFINNLDKSLWMLKIDK